MFSTARPHRALLLCLLGPWAGISVAPAAATAQHGEIRVCEFLASNASGLLDEDADSSDWIELCNHGSTSVDLVGWHLTDDPLDLAKWTLPPRTLAAGQYLLVFASGKDRTPATGELHSNFQLAGQGEYLALVEPDGSTLASSYAPFPPQFGDVSFGLKDQTLEEGFFAVPTPGAPNGDEFAVLATVTYSAQRGHLEAPIVLSLGHQNPDAQIHYTTDGSPPDGPGGQLYQAPLSIDSTTVVRAHATAYGHEDATPTAHSYLFAADTLNQTDADALARGFPAQWIEEDGTHWDLGGTRPGAWYGLDTTITTAYSQEKLRKSLRSVPSLCLSMSVDDWFGDGSSGGTGGIYANSEQNAPQWQRPCSAELVNRGPAPDFQINCGVSIQGNTSTLQDIRNQLSFRLEFKAEYGPTKLLFPLYPDAGVESFDTLILDAGHQNSPNGNEPLDTKRHAQGLRDQFISSLQQGLGGMAPAGRPVHLYLNGLYWGLYNLHENVDERFASSHANASRLLFDFVKEGGVRYGNDNAWDDPDAPGAWDSAVQIAAGGLGPTDLWQGQPAYQAFQEWVDVADYARYLLLNYYGGNTGWPEANWCTTRHSRLSADWADPNPEGAWRMHSWDAESTLHWDGNELLVGDGFYDRTGQTSSTETSAAYFYSALRANPEWCMLFADIAQQLCFHGALFVDPDFATAGMPFDALHPERNRPAALYHGMAKELWPAMIMEYARWGNYWHSPGALTPTDWRIERKRLLEGFFPVRTDVLLAQLRNAQPKLFPDLAAPVFTQHGGLIGPNQTVEIQATPGATIYYTTDGSDPRLEGGGVNPGASVYSSPFQLSGPTVSVKARADNGVEWSALARGDFGVGIRIRINEFQALNTATILDEMGQAEDWVELINPTSVSTDISGWGLSDNPLRPGKWRLPAGTVIPARGFLLVWLDEDQLDGPLHANFKLASAGEQLTLCGPPQHGDVAIDSVSFGQQQPDASCGRIPNGTGPFQHLPEPTPGGANRLAPRTPR